MSSQEMINILRNNGFGYLTMEDKYILDLNWKYNQTGLKCYYVNRSTIKHCGTLYDGNEALHDIENEINEYLKDNGINEKFIFIRSPLTDKKEYNICQEFTTYQTDQRT